jgi:anti-sigma B factor antagonist
MSVELDFDVQEKRDGPKSICLYVRGDLDRHTSPRLRRVMAPYFSGDFQHIRIVLDEVPRMDSSGIATLVEGLQWSRATQGRFVLSGLTDAVHDLFVLSKLDGEFDISDAGVK